MEEGAAFGWPRAWRASRRLVDSKRMHVRRVRCPMYIIYEVSAFSAMINQVATRQEPRAFEALRSATVRANTKDAAAWFLSKLAG